MRAPPRGRERESPMGTRRAEQANGEAEGGVINMGDSRAIDAFGCAS